MGELLLSRERSFSEEKQRHANLFEITGSVVSALELIPAFKDGFEKTFSIALEPGNLTALEWQKVEELRAKEGLLV